MSALRRALAHAKPEVRENAVLSLGEVPGQLDETVVDPLIGLIRQGSDRAASRALRFLAKLGPKAARALDPIRKRWPDSKLPGA